MTGPDFRPPQDAQTHWPDDPAAVGAGLPADAPAYPPPSTRATASETAPSETTVPPGAAAPSTGFEPAASGVTTAQTGAPVPPATEPAASETLASQELAPATETPVKAESEERPHPLTPIVQVWIWLVGGAYFIVREFAESGGKDPRQMWSDTPWFFIVAAVVGVLSIVASLWQWWTTRFVVTPSELRIEHRGVGHDTKRVAFQRIQSVDVTQPFAARLLGLAQLTIDVGGSQPIKIEYLSRGRAVELRDLLLHRAHGRRGAAEAHATSALTDAGDADRVLIKVPPAELLLGAVLSHELLAMIAVTAIPFVIGVFLGEPLLVGGGILPMLFAIGGFLSKRVLGQWNYTLAETPAGLRITRGLTSLSSETLPVHRIQGIRLAEPVLWRRIGRARVDLTFVGMGKGSSDGEGLQATTVLLPIGRPADVATALHAVWPGFELDAIPLTPAPSRARLLAPLALPWIAHGWDDILLVLRRGWWTRVTAVLPHARLQSVRISQGPVERRLGVTSVEAHSAATLGQNPAVFMTDADAALFLRGEAARARLAREREKAGFASTLEGPRLAAGVTGPPTRSTAPRIPAGS